jgi:peptidyl-prolyl cis-trans isomerase D
VLIATGRDSIVLNVFRENLKHLKWLLWVIAITFALFFGVSWYLVPETGGGDPWAAKVNGETISARVWQSVAQNVDEQYRQMFGDQYSRLREAGSLDPGRDAVEQLIWEKIVVQDARRLGLTVPSGELGVLIRELPAFQRNGEFIGVEEYKKLIRRGLLGPYRSERDFEEYLRQSQLQQKWNSLMAASVVVDRSEIEREFRRRHERVAFDYVALPVTRFENEVELDNAAIEAWYEARRDEYSVGEARRALFVLLDTDAVSERIEITDAEVEDYYRRNEQLYTRPEERRTRQVLIRLSPEAPLEDVDAAREEAASIAERARAGEDFRTLAVEFSDDERTVNQGGDMGFNPRGRLTESFEEVVFAMEPGEISDPVRTDDGFHVIKLEEIREGGLRPLEEVREQIVGQLRFQQLDEVSTSLAEELRDEALREGDLESVAGEMGLELRDTGMISRADAIPGLGPVPSLIEAIFAAEEGAIADPVSLPRGTVVFVVENVAQDFLPPINANRERVVADYKRDQARSAALGALREALDGSARDLDAAASRLDVELRSTDAPITRGSTVPEVGVDPRVENEAFAASVGEVVGPIEGRQAVVALRVTEREEPDPTQLEDEAASIENFLRGPRVQALLQHVREKLREDAEVVVNPAIVGTAS